MTIPSLLVYGAVALVIHLPNDSLPVNQVGYYPNAKKIIIIKDTSKTSFSIINADTKTEAYKGTLTPSKFYMPSKEYVRTAEFTDFRTAGSYYCVAGTSDTSQPFAIAPNVYKTALKTLMKSYYFQRASVDLPQTYAGIWNRNAGHPDSALTVIGTTAVNARYNVKGGWYDAGDYGKYVVCAGITCGTLLSLYEMLPDIFSDGDLIIPESSNGKSDLLDELKYEIDWMLSMQDSDGSVFFKVGPITWPGPIMPEDDVTKRYIIGKSTTSALDFASVCALAGRLYRNYDSSYANKCITAAEQAWEWAVKNPTTGYPTDIRGTGPYEDGGDLTYSDERLWASAELYISTGKSFYRDTLLRLMPDNTMSAPAWWQDVKDLSYYSIAQHKGLFTDSIYNEAVTNITDAADRLYRTITSSGYKNAMQQNNFTWGSSGTAGNQAVLLAYAHYLTKNQKYLDCLIMQTDFLFGRNPLGYSFVTGIGNLSPHNIHHRPSQGDTVKEPVPGLVVGGPNASADGVDDLLKSIIMNGTPAAKCYIDNEESYASNEVAINQNAPWIFALAYCEKFADSSVASPVKRPIYSKATPSGKMRAVTLPDGSLIQIPVSGSIAPVFRLTRCNGQVIKTFKPIDNSINLAHYVTLTNGVYFLSEIGNKPMKLIINR